MSKSVAIIPIKSNSERVFKKNFRKVKGKPLYRYLLDKLSNTHFDEIYVDTDSVEIKKYCKKKGYFVINRIPKLLKKSASGNDLLIYHSKIINADIYFQLFVTSPLIKLKTINNCIKILKNTKKYDSILTSESLYTWCWFNNKPVNYNPNKLPRSQDAQPLIIETTGLYGIKRKTLIKKKSRVGNKPFFYHVENEECVDLDNEKDFKYLEYIIKNK